MAPCRQATGTYCADVTQTKYADAHRNYLCVYQAITWPELMVFIVIVHSQVRPYGRRSAACRHTKFRVSK
ncbi:GDP-mannose 6-dehydrogenase [Pseudomonas mandelii JR-1]|uniref:GDP-mannose 6-dehydrogenase n=1 Tax=Pseudomonas mandelii JR-1 TaxID=1147786 RepID=A0A024EAA6_9PSED|nr:GDP-mannose 6-dehydrogenase [Pseudomonas mandelii JR-1]